MGGWVGGGRGLAWGVDGVGIGGGGVCGGGGEKAAADAGIVSVGGWVGGWESTYSWSVF